MLFYFFFACGFLVFRSPSLKNLITATNKWLLPPNINNLYTFLPGFYMHNSEIKKQKHMKN